MFHACGTGGRAEHGIGAPSSRAFRHTSPLDEEGAVYFSGRIEHYNAYRDLSTPGPSEERGGWRNSLSAFCHSRWAPTVEIPATGTVSRRPVFNISNLRIHPIASRPMSSTSAAASRGARGEAVLEGMKQLISCWGWGGLCRNAFHPRGFLPLATRNLRWSMRAAGQAYLSRYGTGRSPPRSRRPCPRLAMIELQSGPRLLSKPGRVKARSRATVRLPGVVFHEVEHASTIRSPTRRDGVICLTITLFGSFQHACIVGVDESDNGSGAAQEPARFDLEAVTTAVTEPGSGQRRGRHLYRRRAFARAARERLSSGRATSTARASAAFPSCCCMEHRWRRCTTACATPRSLERESGRRSPA